jgi:hypothetical protein
MAQPRVSIPQIPEFCPTPDSTTDWTQWITRFKTMLVLQNSNRQADAQLTAPLKNHLLEAHLGEEGFRRYMTLPAMERALNTVTFDALVTSLTGIFAPYVNPIRSDFDFGMRKQSSTETFSEFYTDLCHLASKCTAYNTDDMRNFMMRRQLIIGCYNKDTQTRLLSLPDPVTLEHVIRTMRAEESAHANVIVLDTASTSKAGVHAVTQPPRKGNFRKSEPGSAGKKKSSHCSYCGGDGHKSKNDCPALGKSCSHCGKSNHFAKVCKSPKADAKSQLKAIRISPARKLNAHQVDNSAKSPARKLRAHQEDLNGTIKSIRQKGKGCLAVRRQKGKLSVTHILEPDPGIPSTSDRQDAIFSCTVTLTGDRKRLIPLHFD